VNVIKPLLTCRCDEALLISPIGIVTRVQSCPVCVGRALWWFGDQYELFPGEGESVSVSALRRGTKYVTAETAPIRVEPVADGLPF